jgi:hypothetical protein
MIIKRLFYIISLLLILISVTNVTAQIQVKVTPPLQSVLLPNQATVEVQISNAAHLYSASVTLTFDGAIIQYNSSTNGNLFSGLVFKNPKTNSITVDMSNLALDEISGSGIMFAVTFNTLSEGTSPVTISNCVMRDKDNNTLSTALTSGVINVIGLPRVVSISPQNTFVTTPGTVSLQVNVSNVSNLHSASVTLTFDSTIIRYSSVTPGTFLQSNPMGYSVYVQKTYSPNSTSPNQVKVDQTILGSSTVSGSGLLFTINFTTNNPGVSPATISAFSLLDLNSNVISATSQSGTVSLAVNISAGVIMEGPYNLTTMTTTLNANNLIPLTQPYSVAPWNYAGTESVSAGFFSSHTNIVDWVLLELRTGPTENTVVARRAGFLLKNGLVTDLDGSSALSFFGPPAAGYYFVIRHRNHCSVMTTNPVALSLSNAFYDFTNAMTKAYSYWTPFSSDMVPMRNFGNGKFGMWAGDVSNDDLIDISDLLLMVNDNARFVVGYVNSDVNLDGLVDLTDLILLDNNNNLFARTGLPPVTQAVTRQTESKQ